MSLIVKMMSDEDVSDTDVRKTFILFSEVYDVHFSRDENDAPLMELQFAKGYEAVGDIEVTKIRTEEFAVTGNVYVMNENGKTIASFGRAPIPKIGYSLVQGEEMLAMPMAVAEDISNTLDALREAIAPRALSKSLARAYDLSKKALVRTVCQPGD